MLLNDLAVFLSIDNFLLGYPISYSSIGCIILDSTTIFSKHV